MTRSWLASAALHALLVVAAASSTFAVRRVAARDTAPIRLSPGGAGAAGAPGLPSGREGFPSARPDAPAPAAPELDTAALPDLAPAAPDFGDAPPAERGGRAVEDPMWGRLPGLAGRGRPGEGSGVRRRGGAGGEGSGGPEAAKGGGDGVAGGGAAGGGAPEGAPDSGAGGAGGDGWARREGGRLPVYPAAARRRGLEGTVVLELTVSAEGKVAEVRVAESSGHVSLDDAATEAAWTWTFRPATRAGEPVAARYAMPVTFRLED